MAKLTGYAATVRICLAILVTLVACKDRDIERLTAVKRDVCACKDSRCADQAMSGVPQATIRSTPRTQAIARDIMDCRAKLEAEERPTTDPDTEGGGEGGGDGSGAGSTEGSAAAAPGLPAPKSAR